MSSDEVQPRTLLSIDETAERWGVSPWTVRRLIRAGDLCSVLIGTRRLVPLPAVERAEESGAGGPRKV
jgi:excisionase family DNA binding protein